MVLMIKFKKKELKIFLTFFFIYIIFIHYSGWNESTKTFLTKVIIDEGRLEIDNYSNQTGDRSIFNNHYYSDKDPGPSLIAVPIYGSWKVIYYTFFLNKNIESYNEVKYNSLEFCKTQKILYYQLGYYDKITNIFITIFTSSLLSTLTVLMIYKLSNRYTNELNSTIIAIIYGVGTLNFAYAELFLIIVLGLFLFFYHSI